MLFKQFISFGLVGVLGFLVDAGTYYLSASFIDNPYICRLISYFCAVTFTWIINRVFTFNKLFKDEKKSILLLEWMKFFTSQIFGFIVNYSTFSLLVYSFPFFFDTPILAIAAGSLAGLTVNFFMARLFIFGK